MAKEVVEQTITKTVTKRKTPKKRKPAQQKIFVAKRKPSQQNSISSRAGKIDKAIIENFVSLQKVMTNLSVKFNDLSDKISKLLDVFEISAKSLAEKDFKDFVKVNDEEILEKLDNLLEQNKVIAKGLIMIHEKGSGGRPTHSKERVIEYKPIAHSANSQMSQRKQIIEEEFEEAPPESPSATQPVFSDIGEYTKSIAPPKEV